ncbi:hypothetical protein MASR1M107_03140 [Ignavibacteriales bacterium]
MGKIVHTYELLEQLGEGGMGVVYKARHIHFNEIYAVKRLWEQYSKDPTVLKLFLNEGVTLRGLSHENIVRVHDLFNLGADHYIVMEFIKGRTLSAIIKKETGPIQQERAIGLFRQMLKGIGYIHRQPEPIIHRDIKPLNILVTTDDSVKITDFGIAKALETGRGNASTVVKGTPVYMSPEQIIAPSTVDIRTDVYSLGITFYEMLCGHTPFESKKDTNPTAVYATIMSGEVPPPTHFYPGISDALSDFVMKAIDKDRDQRFANTNEMLKELERLERSGETVYQGTPKFVASKVNKDEDEKPFLYEQKISEPKRRHLPKDEVEAQLKKSSNTWKWVAGLAVLVGIIWGVLSSFNQKVEIPEALPDTVAVEEPATSPDAILEQTKKDAMAAFLEDDNQFTGKYKEENGQVIASIEIKNQSAHTVTISYDKAPLLNTGVGKGIIATVNPDPKEVKAGETGKMTVIFPHKPEAKAPEKDKKTNKSQDNKQTKKYEIIGNMVIKVLNLEKKTNRRITLEKEAKEEN